jgi:hypothetical protein
MGLEFRQNRVLAGASPDTGISFAEHQVSPDARSRGAATLHRKGVRMKGTHKPLDYQVRATFFWEAVLQPIRISP